MEHKYGIKYTILLCTHFPTCITLLNLYKRTSGCVLRVDDKSPLLHRIVLNSFQDGLYHHSKNSLKRPQDHWLYSLKSSAQPVNVLPRGWTSLGKLGFVGCLFYPLLIFPGRFLQIFCMLLSLY